MPNEPERDIEKTLKTYAKQRQDGAGAPRALHPATRKMLRDEALRTHSRVRRRVGFWGALWMSRRRFGVAAGIVAVVAIAAWIMLPGSPKKRAERSLALNRAAPGFREQSASTSENPSAAPPIAPEVALADSNEAKQPAPSQPVNKPRAAQKDRNDVAGTSTLADDKGSLSYKKTVTTDSLSVAKEMQASRLEAGAATNTVTLAAATPAPVPTFDSSSVAPAVHGRAGGGGFGGAGPSSVTAEKYASANVPTNGGTVLKKINGLPVLTSFRLEQTNGQIRMIDSDGSVYAGFVLQTAAAGEALPTFAARDFRTRAGSDVSDAVTTSGSASVVVVAGTLLDKTTPSGARKILFRVAGTNLSLNESVLFTGSLQPGEASPAALLPIAGTGGKLETTQRTRRVPASPSRVMGRVVIGGTNEQEINAEATKP